MSQIVTTDPLIPLVYPIPDSSWDQPLFPPSSDMETVTTNYPHYTHPPSLPYPVSLIGNTSSQPTNYALGMSVSPDFAPKNGQLCLATHQVFEPPLTSFTPAVSLEYQDVLPLRVFIYVSLFRTLSLPMIPNLRTVGRICSYLPRTFLFQAGCNLKAHTTTPIWPVIMA